MTTWQDWEPLLGEQPFAELAVHPSGRFVARQVSVWLHTTVERASVWDAETRKIVWNPGDANALCWTPDGTEVLLIREAYQPKPSARPTVLVTPLQSEFTHTFERRRWPSTDLVEALPFEMPDGWPVAVAVHPFRNLACVVRRDQCLTGVMFVDWAAGPARQLLDADYTVGSNLNSDVAFSPDGRYLVCAFGEECWWSDDPEEPSPGGEFLAGVVVITDLATFEHRDVEVFLSVEAGYLPEDGDITSPALFSRPKFDGNDHFKLMSGMGHSLAFRVTGERLV